MNLTRTILLLTLLLGACGPLEYPGYVMDFRNEQAMQAQVLVNRDPYTGLTTVQSPFGSITRAGYDSVYRAV